MPSTTTHGTPYHTSSDVLTDWPATSQAVAAQIDTILGPLKSAWTAYVPTLTQGAALSKTDAYCRYLKVGRLVIAQVNISVGATGTAGTAFAVSLPTAAAAALSAGSRIGTGHIFDASAGTRYIGAAEVATSTTVTLVTDVTGGNSWGAVPSIALGSTDQISFAVTYEAAS